MRDAGAVTEKFIVVLAPEEVLNCGGMFASASLDFDVDVHQGNGCRSYSGNTAGVAQGSRANFDEFFLHLAGESADRVVIEPLGDTALLGFFQPLDGALLLLEIAFVFDFGFDGFEFVAEFGGKADHRGHRGIAPDK